MSPLPAPAKRARALADRIQRATEVRTPVFARRPVHVVPEEPELPAAAVDAVVRPGFGQLARKCAKLERPDVTAMSRLPGPQVLQDAGIGDTRLFSELAQCGSTYAFAPPDRALHQLDARLRMFERQNLLHRGIPEHNGANLVDRAHSCRSLILRHFPNFFANGMPAWAGLVDGRHS